MFKATILAAAVALGIAIPAQAQTTTTNHDVVEVQTHRNPAGAIIGDTLGGAVAGAAIGGGVVLYDHYITNNGNGGWGNWQRPILIGAGIGAAVGLVFGIVDAGTADKAPNGALVDRRPTGFEPATPVYGMKF